VTLTVTDNDGATASVSHVADAGVAAAQPVSYVGSNSATANATTVSTTIPAGTAVGSALLMSESFASTSQTLTAPAGWTLVGSTAHSNLTTDIYERVAQAGDAGSTVKLTLSGVVKSSLVIAAYANTDTSAPVESSASAVGASSATVSAPALSALSDGTFVVRIYVDKSSATTGWTAPADQTLRKSVVGTGSGATSTLLVDSNGPVGSSVSADSASSNDVSGSEAGWTIALKQVSAH
jgi:methionine-rich copper-binding protein CopC